MNTAAIRTDRPASRPWLHAALAVVPGLTAGILASGATLPNIPTWYEALVKPPGTPPNWLFGPVWTFLYAAIAYAVWRVLETDPRTEGRTRAIVLFYVQLVLNAAWPFSFFAAHDPTLGAVNILVLDLVLVITIRAFARVDRTAAWLLAPYAAWIAYATYLNLGIWRLNP